MINSSTDTIAIPAEKKAHLIDVIRNSGEVLKKKIVTAGFDGFVDSIAKVINFQIKSEDIGRLINRLFCK